MNRPLNGKWGEYTQGDKVTHDGRKARVVAAPVRRVPNGQIPIMYDDEESCYAVVPIDDISKKSF